MLGLLLAVGNPFKEIRWLGTLPRPLPPLIPMAISLITIKTSSQGASPGATIWVINPSQQNCSSHQDCSRPSYITISYIMPNWTAFQPLPASLPASQPSARGMARRNHKAGKQASNQAKQKPRPRPRTELEEINIYETPEWEEILNELSIRPRTRRSLRIYTNILIRRLNIKRAAFDLPPLNLYPDHHRVQFTPKQTRARQRLREKTFAQSRRAVKRITKKYRKDPTFKDYTYPEGLLPEGDPSQDYQRTSTPLSPSPSASDPSQVPSIPSTPSSTDIYGLQARSISSTPSTSSSSESEYHPPSDQPCLISSHRRSRTLRSLTTTPGTLSGPGA